jgi:hypothetical protein
VLVTLQRKRLANADSSPELKLCYLIPNQNNRYVAMNSHPLSSAHAQWPPKLHGHSRLHNVRQGAARTLQKECEEGRTVLAFWQTRLDALLPANVSGISSGCAALAAAGRIQTLWHGAVFSELRVCMAARVSRCCSNEH